MTKRIFCSICFVALMVFLAAVVLIMGVLYTYFSGVQQNQLKMQLNLAAQGVDHEGRAYLRDLMVKDYRITWIAADGSVLYDSKTDGSSMENHLERKEITDAMTTGFGESKRYSATLMERSLYAAQRLSDGTVLRLSISQHSVLTLLFGMMQPICLVFVLAIILSVWLAGRLARSIVQPLNKVDLDNPLNNDGYDEIAPLLRRIDSQQRQLSERKAQLIQKQNELNTIIDSMNEGMLLLNEKGIIISMNSAAIALLETDANCLGADILTVSRNLDLQRMITYALQGEHEVAIIAFPTGIYQIDASPIFAGAQPVGAAICFFDVTEKERAEQMRKEFTANVSHELKTPLHAISGYAELMKNGMVKQEEMIPFAGRIYEESQRMIRLVEDIISLSRLDEGAEDLPVKEVDLFALAAQVITSLRPEAEVRHITLHLTGESAVLSGTSQLLYSIVYNLCDNAIKYNQENGSVTVSVANKKEAVVLSVRDTGIGIEDEQQKRIFERFYRVDKSRSKELGGTGLGLSIVKHAAMIHKAKIEVTSGIGQGTTITVLFPKANHRAAETDC